MNKFKRGDVVRCTHGYNDKNWFRGMKGEVTSVDHFVGVVHYHVCFSPNWDYMWLPADHLEAVKKVKK